MTRVFNRFHLLARHRNQTSSYQNPYLPLDQTLAEARRQRDRLRRLGHNWEPLVRKVLNRLADAKWPEPARRAGFPIPSTRIRRTRDVEKIIWWVEHDIPPYDRYRCAAYFIELELDASGNPVMVLRSGREVYRLQSPSLAALAKQAARLSQEPPAIIPRRMGEAFD